MKLRWPRFSMRFLLIAMLVIGAILGILGSELVRFRKRLRDQRAIITQLESKGAGVRVQLHQNHTLIEPLLEAIEGSSFPEVTGVHLTPGAYEPVDIEAIARLDSSPLMVTCFEARCNDVWLTALAKSRRIFSVSIIGKNCTAKGAHALAQSESPLNTVTLFDFPVDDEFLRLIAKQKTLRHLAIQGEGITEAGFEHISNAADLTSLQMRDAKNLGEGLVKLSDHRNLYTLSLTDTNWSESDLASLTQLKSVRSLFVYSKKLPIGILKAAASMPRLEHLHLQGKWDTSEPTDSLHFPALRILVAQGSGPKCDGLFLQLAQCKTLRQIQIPDFQITAEELTLLTKLPHLDEFTIGSSPSKETIDQFQKAKPYCVYIDGNWGLFQPKIGINPNKIGGGGINKDSILAPVNPK